MKVTGLAIPFSVWSEPLKVKSGLVREMLLPGSCDNTYVWACLNHERSKTLGSTGKDRSSNLKVWQEKDGIHFSLKLEPDTLATKELLAAFEAGEVRGVSFDIKCWNPKDRQNVRISDGNYESTVRKFQSAHIAIITGKHRPAYKQTYCKLVDGQLPLEVLKLQADLAAIVW